MYYLTVKKAIVHYAPTSVHRTKEPEDGCGCDKPRPGMLQTTASDYALNFTKCAVIGDVGSTAMLAAAAVGAIKILVETGWGKQSLEKYRHKWYEQASPDYIAKDLLDAAKWLVGSNHSE